VSASRHARTDNSVFLKKKEDSASLGLFAVITELKLVLIQRHLPIECAPATLDIMVMAIHVLLGVVIVPMVNSGFRVFAQPKINAQLAMITSN